MTVDTLAGMHAIPLSPGWLRSNNQSNSCIQQTPQHASLKNNCHKSKSQSSSNKYLRPIHQEQISNIAMMSNSTVSLPTNPYKLSMVSSESNSPTSLKSSSPISSPSSLESVTGLD